MKTLALISLLLCGCASQDPAMLVTITGAFRIPQDADRLSLDVYDGTNDVRSTSWCVTTTATCTRSLPVQQSLDETVTVVESAGSHPSVKLHVAIYAGPVLVGTGSTVANFAGGTTLPVAITVTQQ